MRFPLANTGSETSSTQTTESETVGYENAVETTERPPPPAS